MVDVKAPVKVSVGLFNCRCYQTSGPSSSCSWRSSTMNACCQTSPPCRRTGVLRASVSCLYAILSVIKMLNDRNVFILRALVLHVCSQKASGERRRTLRAVCPLRQTALVRNTWRPWARSAGHTSGIPPRINTGVIRWNLDTPLSDEPVLHWWSRPI